MANPEHLKILKSGYTAWNKWRDEHPSVIPDFSHAVLKRVKLRTANLRGANFTKSNLAECDLKGVHFSGADLSGARLLKADLQIANLDGAKLVGANLVAADLKFADLRGADLSRAEIGFVNFEATKLDGAIFSKAIAGFTTFKGTNLGGTVGLESVWHQSPSSIDVDTLVFSGGRIPQPFLSGCGVPDSFIVQLPALAAAMQPIQFHSCFISYSGRNEDFARRLHSRMRQADLRVWFAPEDIKGGDKLYDQIDRAIQVLVMILIYRREVKPYLLLTWTY